MNKDTLARALAIHQELERLQQVKDEIQPHRNHGVDEERKLRLTYVFTSSRMREWDMCDRGAMKHIGDVLDRHDAMIRQELDGRIDRLEKELSEL